MVGIKIFECAICKQLFFNNVKNEKRFYGNRSDVREHLRKYHHINRRAGSPEHKGNRLRDGKDSRSSVTQNCILYKEF
jgi:hypothetical protein